MSERAGVSIGRIQNDHHAGWIRQTVESKARLATPAAGLLESGQALSRWDCPRIPSYHHDIEEFIWVARVMRNEKF